MQMQTRRRERGAVSIFIVIFSAILIITIAVGFVQLMLRGQQQATNSDLSRSALDSAYAGVDDAKRALVIYRQQCMGASRPLSCEALQRALYAHDECDTMQQAGISGKPGDSEVVIEQQEGDEVLQQAYTCVKVTMDTSDYLGTLPVGASRLIPLKGVSSFDEVVVEWYSQEDLQTYADDVSSGGVGINLSSNEMLPMLSSWPVNRPALVRAQLIQFGGTFLLSDFDKREDGSSNAHTLFMLPSEVGRSALSFADDARQSPSSGALQRVACNKDFTSVSEERYACRATIKLPQAVGVDGNDRTAFLRLNGIYQEGANFRVSLQQAGVPVLFSNVQPEVDSTGRANDLFRRVISRIELDSNTFPYIDAAVEVTGGSGVCKTFLVTDRTEDFVRGSCGE